jgi:phosphopantetheine adenylyltransferase
MSKKYHNNHSKWVHIGELILILVATLGTNITLYVHTDSKLDAYQQRSFEMVDAIRQDIKDFHNEIKDFHGRLCAIEERNKK